MPKEFRGSCPAHRMCEGDVPVRYRLLVGYSDCERVRTIFVGPRRAGKKADFDEIPDAPDHRDEGNEHPPGRFAAIMKALDRKANRRIEDCYIQNYEQNDAERVSERHGNYGNNNSCDADDH